MRPVTFAGEPVALTVTIEPSAAVARIVKPVIALLPGLPGAVNVIVASPLAVVAASAVGDPGTATATLSATLALAGL